MPDDSGLVPAMVQHYAAYLRAKAHVTPETSVNSDQADVRICVGDSSLVLLFGCRKNKWSLRSAKVRRGEQTTAFRRGELAKATALLLSDEQFTLPSG